MTAARMNTVELAAAFGVSTMTLYLWRQGTATKEPLPFEIDDPEKAKPQVSFVISKARAWAKKHGVEFEVDPVTGKQNQRPDRPGPLPNRLLKKKRKH